MTDQRLPTPAIQSHSTTIHLGDLTIDLDAYAILHPDGTTTVITAQEQLLLRTLLDAQGRVVTKEELGVQAWGWPCGYSASAIFDCVHDLRRKLGDDGRRPRYIQTVRRIGYRMKVLTGAPGGAEATSQPQSAEPAPPS